MHYICFKEHKTRNGSQPILCRGAVKKTVLNNIHCIPGLDTEYNKSNTLKLYNDDYADEYLDEFAYQ